MTYNKTIMVFLKDIRQICIYQTTSSKINKEKYVEEDINIVEASLFLERSIKISLINSYNCNEMACIATLTNDVKNFIFDMNIV